MKELKTEAEFNLFTKDTPVAVVDFSAAWCGPCKKLGPTIEEVSKEMPDVVFAKVDIDTLPSAAEAFDVEGVPTLVLFKDGKEVARQVGAMGKTALKTWLTKSNS